MEPRNVQHTKSSGKILFVVLKFTLPVCTADEKGESGALFAPIAGKISDKKSAKFNCYTVDCNDRSYNRRQKTVSFRLYKF